MKKVMDAEMIAAAKSMHALGVPFTKIAAHLGVYWKTIRNVIYGLHAYEKTE